MLVIYNRNTFIVQPLLSSPRQQLKYLTASKNTKHASLLRPVLVKLVERRYDTQQNDTQHDDIQHNCK